MQISELNANAVAAITQLTSAVNNIVQLNAASTAFLGTPIITASHVTALSAALTTLQADAVTLTNAIPAIVAGN